MTLAFEHKSEENSVGPCFTCPLLVTGTCTKFLILGKLSKNGKLPWRDRCYQRRKVQYFCTAGKVSYVCVHTLWFQQDILSATPFIWDITYFA